MEIVNVVGGGRLGREVDLRALYDDLKHQFIVEYDPESFPGLIFRLEDPKATVMLFSSGKYSLAGAKSHNAANEANQHFISILEPFLQDISEPNFEIRYNVCTDDLRRKLDLNKVVVILGIENTEYEPEQFPGVFYRPTNKDWFAIIFNSGKIVVNGGPEIGILEQASEHIRDILSSSSNNYAK